MATILKVKKYVKSDKPEYANITSRSPFCEAACKWVLAIIAYAEY